MNPAKITVIIISHGFEPLLRQCLVNLEAALKEYRTGPRPKTIVVDNASAIPYRKEDFSGLDFHLIRLDRAHSFAAANNLAAAHNPSDYLLLLNNDVLLHPRTITALTTVMQTRPEAAVCGTRLLFPDDTIQHCGVRFGPGKTGPYHLHRKRSNHLVKRTLDEFQAVTGACCMIRAKVWDELRGLDEGFAFGLEDIDFCLRARQSGRRIFCDNTTDSLHFESMTPGRVKLDIGSRKRFLQKWQGRYSIDG